jgi:uncharacterized protein (TIGR03437 family)
MREFIAERAAFVKNVLAQQKVQPPEGGPVIHTVALDPVSGSVFTPGSTARILGTDFAAGAQLNGQSGTPSSRNFVAVEGVRAQIVSMSPVEAVIWLPADLPLGSAAVAVAAGGKLSNTIDIPILP